MTRRTRPAVVLAAMVLAASVAATAAQAAPHFTLLTRVNAAATPAVAFARTADGRLHLVFQTFGSGAGFSGLGTLSISPSGHPDPVIEALPAWGTGQPGLFALPNGELHAVFAATSPTNVASVWQIVSTDGGATWSAPANVRGGGPNEAGSYAADITAVAAGSTPFTSLGCCGNVVVQTGLGSGSPSVVVTTPADGAAGNTELGVDASTGTVVASWNSIAGNPTNYLQQVGPTVGSVQKVPGQSRNALELAGRDTGPGVFAAYTPDDTHVRLLRYGGGSIAVGSLKGTTPKALGVATSLDGRIWVMWGDDSGGGIAVTRSNKGVTRFEPIQRVDPHTSDLFRISGDGRLGPLDLLVDMLPNVKGPIPPTGLYYAHVLPVLSAGVTVTAIKNKLGVVVAHTLKVTVTDAGDAVAGATVSLGGKTTKTNAKGLATLVLAGAGGKLTVTSPGYQTLTQAVTY